MPALTQAHPLLMQMISVNATDWARDFRFGHCHNNSHAVGVMAKLDSWLFERPQHINCNISIERDVLNYYVENIPTNQLNTT